MIFPIDNSKGRMKCKKDGLLKRDLVYNIAEAVEAESDETSKGSKRRERKTQTKARQRNENNLNPLHASHPLREENQERK